MRFVADRGGLTTDPQLDSYYLWDLMMSGSIYGAEYANELRGYAAAVAAKGTANPDEEAQLLTLSRQLQFTAALVERDSSSMSRYNPGTQIIARATDSRGALPTQQRKVNQISQSEVAGKADGKAFCGWRQFDGERVLSTVRSFPEGGMADLVTARISNLSGQKTTQLGLVLGVALMAIALVYWIWRGINSQVNSMTLTFRANLRRRSARPCRCVEQGRIGTLGDFIEQYGRQHARSGARDARSATASSRTSPSCSRRSAAWLTAI